MNTRPMLNAYPDSMGGRLSAAVELLSGEPMKGAFSSFYILPSLYHHDLDRGFSVVDYGINEALASKEDLEHLRDLGIDLKLDFVLNHASARSPQFMDLVKNGDSSEYKDFFIDWNRFWEGSGEMTEEGYVRPRQEYLDVMFFRKPGLPLLMVEFPDGTKHPYWNTFYQEVKDGEYYGQMDLNVKSPMVWDFYRDTLKTLASYGAATVRLDAFAYADKEVGERNFLNEPGTWQLLEKVKGLAAPDGLELLPEIHASYSEGVFRQIADKGYVGYDFFLPGLLIDAIANGRSEYLAKWAQEIVDSDMKLVNMLGCHDGIPVLDLKGFLPDEDIDSLIDLIVSRGGMVKNLHGQTNMYYQVNAAYYSALGADDDAMLLARAIQLFMPAKPQIWYLDLFAGRNDIEAASAGESSHKEINRTNLTDAQIREALKKPVVKEQLELIKLRNSHPAFAEGAEVTVDSTPDTLTLTWKNGDDAATLRADLKNVKYEIDATPVPSITQ